MSYSYPSRRSSDYRRLAFGALFAILLSMSSVLVLCYGFVGTNGNSLFTGTLLLGCIVAIGLVCFRRDFALVKADYFFLLFLLAISFSFALNGQSSNTKESALLALSLAAYPACRFVTEIDLIKGRPSFLAVSSVIVVLGAIATAVAVFQQWDDQHGKPLVFGFDAAPANFLLSLGFLILAVVSAVSLTARGTALFSVFIFLPVAIFAASQVRFTFIALVISLLVAAGFSGIAQRKRIIIVTAVVLLAMASGLAARYAKTRLFTNFAFEQSSGVITWKRPPSCDLNVNLKNSIAIRKALTLDALFLMPDAGWVGTGLDSFMNFSCIKLHEVHNSFLQAITEFGWAGGASLVLMTVFAGLSILPLARQGGVPLFLLCALTFIVSLSMVHGRLSRDTVLFAILGAIGAGGNLTRERDVNHPG